MYDGIIGVVIGALISLFYYRLGKRDANSTFRRNLLSFVVLRLKQTIPTSRQKIPEHYDLSDTAHWLSCISEVLIEGGFREDADAIRSVLEKIESTPENEHPSEEQRTKGEADKKIWIFDIHKQIKKIK